MVLIFQVIQKRLFHRGGAPKAVGTGDSPAWIFRSRNRVEWVAQATRLCRSATRRPKGESTRHPQKAVTLPVVAVGLPPGQWPGGTGESPVPPRTQEMSWREPVECPRHGARLDRPVSE